MKPLLALLALLLLAACSTKHTPLITSTPRPYPSPTPMEILIETSPPGGIVDWNGDVIGASPVTLTITPNLGRGGRPVWPETGHIGQTFRARWPNGRMAFEYFRGDAIPPHHIAIIDLYFRPYPAPTPRPLHQKNTP